MSHSEGFKWLTHTQNGWIILCFIMSQHGWCNDDVIKKSKIKSREWLWLVQKRNDFNERYQRKFHSRSTKINSDTPSPKRGFENCPSSDRLGPGLRSYWLVTDIGQKFGKWTGPNNLPKSKTPNFRSNISNRIRTVYNARSTRQNSFTVNDRVGRTCLSHWLKNPLIPYFWDFDIY